MMRFNPCKNGPFYGMFVLLSFWLSPLYADFSSENRSINGTGEILKPHQCELGYRSLACSISEEWMITVPSFAIVNGAGQWDLKRRFKWSDEFRLTPNFGAGTPLNIHAGLDLGIDFGDQHQHSLTLSPTFRFSPKSDVPVGNDPALKQHHVKFEPSWNYDWYLGGNLLYLGMIQKMPYVGYTWAWEQFFAGIVVTPVGKRVLPLPYFYFRF